MTTNTPAVLPPSRDDPRQVENTLRLRFQWNTPGVATGINFANSIPKGAFITRVLIEVITGFNGTTPVMSVGTNGTIDNLATGADIVEATPGINDPTRGLGRSIPAAADVTPKVKLLITDTTAGEAEVCITYAGSAPT